MGSLLVLLGGACARAARLADADADIVDVGLDDPPAGRGRAATVADAIVTSADHEVSGCHALAQTRKLQLCVSAISASVRVCHAVSQTLCECRCVRQTHVAFRPLWR
jgi:hypothetical protein